MSFLFQGTWALAATTGGLAGVVHDDTGAPIAGASVTATSPSQTATTTTDAQGHFVFLVLQPDTYTLTVAKDGYQTTSLAGNTIFADQTQQVVLTAPRAIKVIAHVTGTAAGLVKPGVSGDLYNVTPAQQTASVALGGGGNLASAYSAIAAVPGVFLGTGEMGWDQAVVIHGQQPFFTGFEVEGIPVNRAFDNYPSSTESNLGLQELQIYTGGGPSDITSNGVSGFINSVIKTGTYPGYANLTLGTASEAFWHLATLEIGGATPDRNFSYYVGISGYDQQFRFINNNEGASLMTDGQPYQGLDPYFTNYTATGRGVIDDCPDSNPYPYPDTPGSPGAPDLTPFGCNVTGWGLFDSTQAIDDRENIVNLHFAIPRADGQRDDLQAFWEQSDMLTTAASELGGAGPGLSEGQNYVGYGSVCSIFAYADTGCAAQPSYFTSYNYNLPFGSNVQPSGVPLTPTLYGMPNTPASAFANGCAGYNVLAGGAGSSCSLPTDDPTLDNDRNDLGALKLQWTHPFSDTSYMRIFGYSLFSDWNMTSPTGASTIYYEPTALEYILDTHTVGGSLAYANQISDTDLFSFEANVETAGTIRMNQDSNMIDEAEFGGSEVALVSESGGKYTCYDQANLYGGGQGSVIPCAYSGYNYGLDATGPGVATCPFGLAALCPATYGTSEANYLGNEPAITGAAAAAGAQYISLWNGNATGDYNNVRPLFWNFSLHDEFRPNDKWLFDVSMRFDNFTENLPNGVNAADNFETQIIDNDVCWNPTLGVLTYPLTPGVPPPASINYETTCPTTMIGTKSYTYIHPPFTDANLTGNQYTTYDWEPRFGFTYTEDPNTVWTFSAGRYAQPDLSASDQYLLEGGGSTASETWGDFLDQGFFSPEHEEPNMTSAQYNGSFEHRFRGTNISVKISPFYSATSNFLEDSFIGENYVTEIPLGRAKNYGVELSLQDGDFNANGLSGMLSFTWTQSLEQFQSLLGLNQVEQMNTAIEGYNELTAKGGGFACYENGVGYSKSTATCDAAGTALDPSCSNYVTSTNPAAPGCSIIMNPYYNDSPQGLLNPDGWYPQEYIALSAPADNDNAEWYNSPYVTALVLNWRKDRFAITPSLQFQAGTPYGSPFDVIGEDPRDCEFNQTIDVVPGANGYNCDITTAGLGAGTYGYLYAPNPQTGTFASPGEYSEPNIVLGNLQLSYDFPHVKVTLTATDLWHTCFGGSSEPWTAAYPPNNYTCAYFANSSYNGDNWYNGTSPNDKAANFVTPYQYEEESYAPSSSSIYNGYIPFNLYLQAQIHI